MEVADQYCYCCKKVFFFSKSIQEHIAFFGDAQKGSGQFIQGDQEFFLKERLTFSSKKML